MLFEVFDLQYASPATISRCGMVYVDPKNLGYFPFYERWCKKKLEDYSEIMYESLKELYQIYVPYVVNRVFEGIESEELDPVEPLRFITPRTNLNCVQQLCTLFDALLPPENAPQEIEQLEKTYIFCLIWSFGGSLVNDDREKFDKFIRGCGNSLPPSSSFYDNITELSTQNWVPWERKVEKYIPPEDSKFSKILVPTVDTMRYSWLLDKIMGINKPCMYVGDSGTAKSVTIFHCLKQLDPEKNIILNTNFSSRTTSADCQTTLEENIEKKSFKQYGPTGGRKLIFFIDDLNMPNIDIYGTQQPIALLKFLVERNEMYERGGELELREIVGTQYIGAMSPPGGGNNSVDPRFMSLFSVFNITFPSESAIESIYTQILEKHLQGRDYDEEIYKNIPLKMTRATIQLYNQIKERLPRTPVKFHYIFNLRDLSRVYEGICRSTIDKFPTKEHLVRLWRNEIMRVFSDRLVSNTDKELVNNELILKYVSEYFPGTEETVMQDPLLIGDYALADPIDDEGEDPKLYEDLGDFDAVSKKMDKMLEDYSYDHKAMDLVLFEDALSHCTRIHRIIRFPRGNALLVGVGGSGKQSLTKLATFTASYQLQMINLARNYKEENFREDLREIYSGVIQKETSFLFTDAHVVEEGTFLEILNNMLTVGMVPGLFPEDEKDALMSSIEDDARREGVPESKEAKWNYFVNRCRDNLHIVLAFSPAGDTLRIRCRNFPGLVSSTSIDWFFPWPEEALTTVANHFLMEEDIEQKLKEPITQHIVMVHLSVQDYSVHYEAQFKRRNFSTPKNYLDFINAYTKKLKEDRKILDGKVHRLEGGLTTLEKASKETEELSLVLKEKNKVIKENAAVVEALIADINEKSEIAGKQQAAASEKKEYLAVESVKIEKEEAEAAKALEAAIPAFEEAKDALKNVDKNEIVEIRSLPQPPMLVQQVCTLTYYLYPTARNLSNDEWAVVKQNLLGDTKMLNTLKEYKIEKLRADPVRRAKNKIQEIGKKAGVPDDPLALNEMILKSSKAAAGLFTWVKANLKCYEIYREVAPKQKKAAEMKKMLETAQKELAETEANLNELNAKLAELNAEMEEKQTELNKLKDESARMQKRLDAATKLITGLGSEQKRWTQDMKTFEEDKVKLIGD
jgi:dynein heavy chain